MVKKSSGQGLGWWAFLIGLVVVVISGFMQRPESWLWVLVVLGLAVGYLNISDREATKFLVASIALMLAGSANLQMLWQPLGNMLTSLVVLVAPAALVVGIKTVYEAAK